MGQEEMRRRCRMSGRRCRANRKRLTKIFTINKGDAIMKKRIIALALACMLICSIAVTASAEVIDTGMYNGAFYSASTYCSTTRCGGTLEYGGSATIRVDLTYRNTRGTEYSYPGENSTMIATNSRVLANLKQVTARYCFNNVVVVTRTVNAS